ncbi:40S ribosomal protein S15A [Spraguea lophii 42_110]|uniref:40S ribosomal protein S15A n=1 Tax=Spraguea lophii (strain 42_110) TaxID=1358809 RepID=S7XK92_SPRLO|nr:Chain SW0, 40S ribosomal protein S15A [Spraguea lophii 42_110]7QJH_RW0 Chain RW0, 40S ribosomal protein S15A [Spraguea lophii 42_110]7QJH_SW0 Chain SW0, 40S ribosomal protein S15A [Spraguea lophii 42_110]8BR3_SW0 Chain SW0, 40S ribosomal protein S15A [Spraguea lophii 42_110]8P5D_SW0 Chain SW0, 40S ribosomal protein S15A [Spraguea lophii 42_110]8P60_RW0 Chain RW0, 40S ribosomal protein S15A [Spraguea lophii 42_110]8P60_SW0 Chain SW0, 40S ribosomal protein S15A [Spraguea lophii 42_110]EPR79
MMDKLANLCITINNANRAQKRSVVIRRISKVCRLFLESMQKHGYITDIVYIDDHREGKAVVGLSGRLNRCGAICPRYDVELKDVERYRANLLPSRGFGHLIVTSSKGLIDHRECIQHNTGGKILGYFY